MKTQQLLILFLISLIPLWASETVPISILPVQVPYEDFPQKDEMNAYIHSSFQYSSNDWSYQILPENNQRCSDVECHFKTLLEYQPNVQLILIPEVLSHGSFMVLNLKLIELPTLRIRQDVDLHFNKQEYPGFQDYKLLFKKLAIDHFESQSEIEEYYRARPKKSATIMERVTTWWPALLFLPILFLYPTYGGES